MLILMGRTASGKTLVRDKLVKNHGFNSVVTYTTRPMRKDEIPDVTYHYISEEDFLQKVESGFLQNGRNTLPLKVFGIMDQQKKIMKKQTKTL